MWKRPVSYTCQYSAQKGTAVSPGPLGVGSVGASGVSHSDAKATPSVTSQAEDKMHSALGDTLVSWGSRLDISWGYKCRYTCDTNVCELSICTAGVVS